MRNVGYCQHGGIQAAARRAGQHIERNSMQFFTKMKLLSRLILIVILPLVGFMSFSIEDIIEKYEIAQEMGNLESLAGLSVKLGDLAHELQKERGMSAGFLGSKGSKFAAE
ncbi:MAG: nitrate- and nitrite sensing domain-containing protein, partial [Gallionella sp.]|nr:nitrate- and nitrite sensing domain-containing protein [Gallionella sp.]